MAHVGDYTNKVRILENPPQLAPRLDIMLEITQLADVVIFVNVVQVIEKTLNLLILDSSLTNLSINDH